ncbi:transmembrane protein, putative [Bodo saltans]|uniref:Transmembrane protein, putative n=1 Tax=Bodo saltans TaxID=75058 RepID=A0A0S4JI65_BODSA|nr:transmembrane protein, putative [Bodo saltans]|eukprot:CUG89150.1 transmembrane protein, putative [Bodo saltans]
MMFSGEVPVLRSVVNYLLGGTGTLGGEQSSMPYFLTMLNSGNRVDVAASLYPQRLWMHLLLNATLISMMNYVIFLNCSVNSPLAHAVTGNVKGVITVIAGIVLFSVPMRPMAMVGIVVGFSGGAWFSLVKLQHQQAKGAVVQSGAITKATNGGSAEGIDVCTS